jgi:hypothetical protein
MHAAVLEATVLWVHASGGGSLMKLQAGIALLYLYEQILVPVCSWTCLAAFQEAAVSVAAATRASWGRQITEASI